ncbi:MAG: hypothetical protein ACRDLN_00920 [Solirubrobacteraceae bacterium]
MNNREIASVIWIGIAFVWAFVKVPGFGRALVSMLKTLVAPRLALPLLAMLGYLGGLVYGGARVGLWNWSLASDTVAWIILTGLGLFGASLSLFKRAGSFKRILLGALGITVFAEVFVNLYVFPLLVELVLAPVLVCLAATSFVAGGEAGLNPIRKGADGLLAVIGFAMIVLVGIRLVREWGDFRQTQGWQRFALPVWLTLGAMPVVAVLGVYSVYDSAFVRIRLVRDWRRRWRSRFALLTGLGLRARDVAEFHGVWCRRLTAASSLGEARTVVRRFRKRDPDGSVAM